MSKISKIANKGIQYDLGGSSSYLKYINVGSYSDNIPIIGSICLNNKYRLDNQQHTTLIIAYINLKSVRGNSFEVYGNFSGYEGQVSFMGFDAYNRATGCSLNIETNSISIFMNRDTSDIEATCIASYFHN